ncbi:MAG: hypothetical protein H6608_10000 [Flavobacteriales bacterium]|nr:hypothetical protein [Flavobacteriales bacterium]
MAACISTALKIKVNALITCLLAWASLPLVAQNIPACGTDALMNKLYQNAQVRTRRDSINAYLQAYQMTHDQHDYIQENDALNQVGSQGLITASCPGKEYVYTIPTVVHVIHSTTDSLPGMGANLSDSYIQSLIKNLNDGFRNRGYFSGGPSNTNPIVQDADIHIQFKLTAYDNNYSTQYFKGASGICRWKDNNYLKIPNDATDRDMKNTIRAYHNYSFPTNKFLNIYIVPQSDIGAGYAYLAEAAGVSYDGIVVVAAYATPSDRGVTLIHEAGHYLNLLHTFEEGCSNPAKDCYADGDRVCDTPPQTSSGSSTKCYNSCSNDQYGSNTPFTSDQPDLCEDYMDYSAHSIKNTFTNGQRNRMRGALLGPRKTLLDWSKMLDSAEYAAEFSVKPGQHFFACDTLFTPTISLANLGSAPIDSFKVSVTHNGKMLYDQTVSKAINGRQTADVKLTPIALSTSYNVLEIKLVSIQNGTKNYIPNPDQCYEVTFIDSINTSHREHFKDSATSFWTIINPDHQLGLELTGVKGCDSMNGMGLMYHSFTNNGTNRYESEYLISRVINPGNHDVARLRFDRAYVNSIDNYNTILDVRVSSGCQDSFTTVYSKNQSELASKSGTIFTDWAPTSCSEWKRDSVVLDSFISRGTMLIQFVVHTDSFTSGLVKFGNNLYLDDIDLELRDCPPAPGHLRDTVLCGSDVTIQAPPYKSYHWSTGDSTQSVAFHTSGVFYLDAEGAYQCPYRDSITVVLNPLPKSGLPMDTLSCSGDIQLTANTTVQNTWNTGENGASITVKQSGLYRVNMKDGKGCSATDSIYVKLSIPPSPPTISKSFDVLESSRKGNGNQWYIDGIPVDGGIRDYITPKKNGVYTIRYTDTGGCASEPSTGYVVNWFVGMSDLSTNWTIYPNPFTSFFTVDGLSADASIDLIDLLGRPVKSSIVRNANQTIIYPNSDDRVLLMVITSPTGRSVHQLIRVN